MMTSKLIYYAWIEKHLHSALELFAKMVSNIRGVKGSLKALAILAKRFVLDAWLGPKCSSAGGCKQNSS